MVRARMVMSRGNYDASESENDVAPAADDSDASSIRLPTGEMIF